MLNHWRMPWWHNLFWMIVLITRRIIQFIMGVVCLTAPFIALWAMVKLTPFFMTLR